MFEYRRIHVFDYTNPEWDAQAARAREAGRKFAEDVAPYAKGRGVDRDANLCAVQSEQAGKGVVWATFFKNIYGWCVRDTNNNGGGRLSPNFKTVPEVLAWAAEWHAKDTDKRRVDYLFGRMEEENAEFARGLVSYFRPAEFWTEEAPAETDAPVWAWEYKIRVADDPEGNETRYFIREDLLKQSGDLFALAATMRPGDSFSYTSEEALTTISFKCSDGRDS